MFFCIWELDAVIKHAGFGCCTLKQGRKWWQSKTICLGHHFLSLFLWGAETDSVALILRRSNTLPLFALIPTQQLLLQLFVCSSSLVAICTHSAQVKMARWCIGRSNLWVSFRVLLAAAKFPTVNTWNRSTLGYFIMRMYCNKEKNRSKPPR